MPGRRLAIALLLLGLPRLATADADADRSGAHDGARMRPIDVPLSCRPRRAHARACIGAFATPFGIVVGYRRPFRPADTGRTPDRLFRRGSQLVLGWSERASCQAGGPACMDRPDPPTLHGALLVTSVPADVREVCLEREVPRVCARVAGR